MPARHGFVTSTLKSFRLSCRSIIMSRRTVRSTLYARRLPGAIGSSTDLASPERYKLLDPAQSYH
jgi:hypothetical protein